MDQLRRRYAAKTSDYPDIQLLFSSSSDAYKSGILFSHAENVEPDVASALFENIMNRYYFEVQAVLLRPNSRGHIELRTTNPDDNPRIFTNYFDDPRDLQVLVRHMCSRIVHIEESCRTHESLISVLLLDISKYLRMRDINGGEIKKEIEIASYFANCELHIERSQVRLNVARFRETVRQLSCESRDYKSYADVSGGRCEIRGEDGSY